MAKGLAKAHTLGINASRSEAFERHADEDGRQANGFRSGERVGSVPLAAAMTRDDGRPDEVDGEGTIVERFSTRLPSNWKAKKLTPAQIYFALGEVDLRKMATGKQHSRQKSRSELICGNSDDGARFHCPT